MMNRMTPMTSHAVQALTGSTTRLQPLLCAGHASHVCTCCPVGIDLAVLKSGARSLSVRHLKRIPAFEDRHCCPVNKEAM